MSIGMPEAQLTLAQATTYLAAAAKSNRSMVALNRAQKDIRERGAAPVPLHLRNAAHPGLGQFGHGKGYLYPHDYPGGWIPQEYMPDAAKSGVYYEPSDIGHEARIKARMAERRPRSDLSDLSDTSDPSDAHDQ
jgi:putative ATPase